MVEFIKHLREKNQARIAIERVEKFLERFPYCSQLYLAYIELLVEGNEIAKAKAISQEAIKKFDGDQIFYQRVKTALQQQSSLEHDELDSENGAVADNPELENDAVADTPESDNSVVGDQKDQPEEFPPLPSQQRTGIREPASVPEPAIIDKTVYIKTADPFMPAMPAALHEFLNNTIRTAAPESKSAALEQEIESNESPEVDVLQDDDDQPLPFDNSLNDLEADNQRYTTYNYYFNDSAHYVTLYYDELQKIFFYQGAKEVWYQLEMFKQRDELELWYFDNQSHTKYVIKFDLNGALYFNGEAGRQVIGQGIAIASANDSTHAGVTRKLQAATPTPTRPSVPSIDPTGSVATATVDAGQQQAFPPRLGEQRVSPEAPPPDSKRHPDQGLIAGRQPQKPTYRFTTN